MKIKSLEFTHKDQNWSVKHTEFGSLVLLVGATGAGKTQILEAIDRLKIIAQGEGLIGVKWEISFETANNTYKWSGEFGTLKKTNDKSLLLNEKIIENGETLVERDLHTDNILGNTHYKLSRDKSVLDSLDEAFAHNIVNGFKKINYESLSKRSREQVRGIGVSDKDINDVINDLKTIEEIRESQKYPTLAKLFAAYTFKLADFENLKENFTDIFDNVKDIKLDFILHSNLRRVKDVLFEAPTIFIQDKFSGNWVPQTEIASGMLRVLYQLADLYFTEPGSVFLIDEFENSLGVNCLNEITDLIMEKANEHQFILTSHHPYIINRIPIEHWQLVTRSCGEITTHMAENLIEKSNHENFIQLVNLKAFRSGLTENIES